MIYDIQKHAYLLARNSNKFWKDSDSRFQDAQKVDFVIGF